MGPAHPIQSDGQPRGFLTCSEPVKGVNTGCPRWRICKEPERGINPVRVFVTDKLQRSVRWFHCEQWYKPDGPRTQEERYTRIERPERIAVTFAETKTNPVTGKPQVETRTRLTVAPPKDMLGTDGDDQFYTSNMAPDLISASLKDDKDPAAAELDELSDTFTPEGTDEPIPVNEYRTEGGSVTQATIANRRAQRIAAHAAERVAQRGG